MDFCISSESLQNSNAVNFNFEPLLDFMSFENVSYDNMLKFGIHVGKRMSCNNFKFLKCHQHCKLWGMDMTK